MSNLRHSSPFTPDIRLKSEESKLDEESKLKDAEAAIQELKNLELLPLVLDIVEDVNSGKLLPKDVDNAAGTLKVRINKAREILRNIHGLSETPDERAARVERLTKNISRKTAALQKLRARVGERITLPDPPTPKEDEDEVMKETKLESVEPQSPQDEQKADNVRKETPTPQTEAQNDGTIQSQPLQQSDTFMTEDTANFDFENFNDFPAIGNQDNDQDGDINMDTS
ncbi:hypothetical protein WICANDRAFT_64455 [Wickerhamomyces anomalus NRRL Y-366-8]|uniref:Mediator of RNA polymerase II transcription subunit 9 n=1 Tax=Wickerhamomyces anomalus (strain ATCC 58044 / CBS 1984 / NCYC 433 / NRRL Y-366-8) TaxID=683960 RepID=A0A1E3NYN8_WICAA|nr:uncharacterized protein WICANDRAFT_64455 [Wickerhamomyces anomalus NRRL Y-366-8]ODQ58319.1 hypothetical protein WICANDRAFT_64455 [Wickerhamomyces anomalus NRRL Y-366-8]